MKLIESKIAAWVALVMVVVLTCVTFPMFREYWWSFSVEFFAFMMVFSQLASLYLGRISPVAGKQLRMCALVFGILVASGLHSRLCRLPIPCRIIT